MAGPPKDVEPSALFRKLLEKRPSDVINFPRKDADGNPVGKVRLQVLNQKEHEDARERAYASMKGKNLTRDDMTSELIREVIGDATAREILAMACLTEEGPDFGDGPVHGRIFRDAHDLKDIRPAELAFLFDAYQVTQAKYGPFEGNIDGPEDINAWVKALGEGGSAVPLLSRPLPHLALLALSLGERAYMLSRILDFLWSNLPDTFKSDLAKFSMGTGFYGEPAENSDQSGTEN